MMIDIESAGITDIGKCREGNEDAILIDDDIGLYIVADGVGGHKAGEVASHLVVENMSHTIKKLTSGDSAGELMDPDPTLSSAANRLLSSIHIANRDIHMSSNSIEDYHGMGSTVSAVYFADESLIAANVGDSPIYLIRNGTIDLLSKPHTFLADQVLTGHDGTQQTGNALKHVLTQAMGIEQTVTAEVYEIQWFPDDIVVICSDGLSNKLCPDEIAKIVTGERPNISCRSLIHLANERGGDDNITVIVLTVNKAKKIKRRISRLVSKIFSEEMR